MSQAPDVVIIGGGVIGLSIAWQLARTGVTVRVLERDRIGSHASSAAAGMLAPLAESDGPDSLFEFGKASLDLYSVFLEQLAFDSGMEVLLEGPGLLRLALSGEAADSLLRLGSTAEAKAMGVEWLDDRSLRELQPGVSDDAVGALLSPQEKHVDPRRLLQALVKACERLRVSFLEGLHAERSATNLEAGPKVIYAAGAWTGELIDVPMRPVKGQVIQLEQTGHDLSYTLFGGEGYLVPRTDGIVLVGATSEDAGFDERITDEAMDVLVDRAVTLYPSARDFEFVDSWASIRPGTLDGLPILGALPGQEGSYVATGHYRNGILQAPITAKLIAELIVNGRVPHELEPFSPNRFQKAGQI